MNFPRFRKTIRTVVFLKRAKKQVFAAYWKIVPDTPALGDVLCGRHAKTTEQ